MFPEYVKEMAEDCGYVDNVPDWIEIDWEEPPATSPLTTMVGVEIDGREEYFSAAPAGAGRGRSLPPSPGTSWGLRRP